jgi:hypothetical protein
MENGFRKALTNDNNNPNYHTGSRKAFAVENSDDGAGGRRFL